jgi:hypothetical protein
MKIFGKFLTLILVIFGLLFLYQNLYLTKKKNEKVIRPLKLDRVIGRVEYLSSTIKLLPTLSLKKVTILPPTLKLSPTPSLMPTKDNEEWGKAKQLSEHTWTMKVGLDDKMATPQEIFEALNNYRRQHAREALTWDDRLAALAQMRAQAFTSLGSTDEHRGFFEYTNNLDNVKSLGFWSLGENSTYGYRLTGVHLIEWIYAADEGHNANQLNSQWSYVGIGVDGTQTDLIFGGNKM